MPMVGSVYFPIWYQVVFTCDEVSSVAADNCTNRDISVVLVLKFFRIGIVFVTRSYENIVRSIRRRFRRHTDWIAAGQCTRNSDIFVGWQIDVVVCARFFIATDVQVTGNTECIAAKIYTAAVAVRGVSGDAAAVHCKRAFTLKINTAAITGCSITGDVRRFGNGHITTRITIVKHTTALYSRIVFNHAVAGYFEFVAVRADAAASSVRCVITDGAAVYIHSTTAPHCHAAGVCFGVVITDGTAVHRKCATGLRAYTATAVVRPGIFLIVIADGASIHFKSAVLYLHTCTTSPPAVLIDMIAADRSAVHVKCGGSVA